MLRGMPPLGLLDGREFGEFLDGTVTQPSF